MNNPEYKNSRATLSEARYSECVKIVSANLKAGLGLESCDNGSITA